MPVPNLTTQRTGDRVIDKIIDWAQSLCTFLISAPHIDGILIENVALTTAATGNIIQHRLDRNYRGYIITKNNTHTLTTSDLGTGD